MTQYRQTFPNSCGAASLMCAAVELGTTAVPQDTTVHAMWFAAQPMASPNLACENLIYAVTSGATGFATAASGYSLPSRIGKAARALGLTTIAFVPTSIIGTALLALYGTEELDAKSVGTLTVRKAAPLPTEGQRLLKVMRVGDATSKLPATGLHYVMLRPDGTVMDPANGQNFPDMDILIAAQNAQDVFYADTGVAILIA